jgi:NAD(P)-dependent dehydrogenase (short-subunit alcohol dehydrogenase family)
MKILVTGGTCKVGAQEVAIGDLLDPVSVQKAVKGSFPTAVLETQRNGRALKRDEQAEDLVGAVFFLASREADFITGQTINVDGGERRI